MPNDQPPRQGPIVLATRSLGKLHELKPIFTAAGLSVLDLDQAGVPESREEDDLEHFETFEENAQAKARWFHARTGLPTVADDSGLEVVALGGAPGVRTKRWSGRDDLAGRDLDAANNAKMLSEMQGVVDRRARYVCVAAYVDDRATQAFRGTAEGELLTAPRGSGGFGYDPLFWSTELGATFGELDREAKERVSHRGRAFAALLAWLGVSRALRG